MSRRITEQGRALIEQMLEAAHPPPSWTISEYADLFRILPQDEAVPGQWVTEFTQYLQEPMDCLTPSNPCKICAMMKGSQTCGTEALILNAIAYWIAIAPGRILSILPTEGDAGDFSRQRIDPMIDLMPAIRRKVGAGKAKNLLLKDFPGGSLKMVGAKSPGALRSKPAPFILADEVDNWSVTKEGCPLYLARKRQTNFTERKTAIVSTPLEDGNSTILQWFLTGDRCTYWMPCPHCDEWFLLEWKLVQFSDDAGVKDLDSVHVSCPNNGCYIVNSDKRHMIPLGQWRPMASLDPAEKQAALRAVGLVNEHGAVDARVETTLQDPEVRSFHISSLFSPFPSYTWTHIVREFLAALNNPDLMQVWTNTVLGQTWKTADGETVSDNELYARREFFPTKLSASDVAIITAGVDIQKNRIEVEIVAWGRGFQSWSIGYIIIPGDPLGTLVWRDLDTVLAKRYALDDGTSLPIEAICVDSSYFTEAVYKYCKPRMKSRIWAVKGVNKDAKQETEIWPSRWSDTKKSGTLKFKSIGVNRCKRHVYERLAIENPGPGFCHFPDERSKEWFEQLTAEKYITRLHKGQPYMTWNLPKGKSNEALDCRVYAYAAIVGLEAANRTIESVLRRREANKLALDSGVPAGTLRPRSKSTADQWIPERDW